LAIWLYFSLSSTGFDPLKRLNLRFRTQPVDNHVDKSFLGKRCEMAVIEMELTDLWGRVIDVVAADAPQHRAFLSLTKPLGLLQSDGTTNLLVAAPNAFAKDVLETRLRALVSEVLTRELGEKTNIAVTIDETLEATDLPAPDVDIYPCY
jgi:hypothetical protein